MSQPQKQKADRAREGASKTRLQGALNKGPEALQEVPDLLALQRALVDPGTAPPGGILALQFTYGNQAVQRLLTQRHEDATGPFPPVQRRCWRPSEEVITSFHQLNMTLPHEAGGTYFRFQGDDTANKTSPYYGEWTHKHTQAIADNIIDSEERKDLAIFEKWTPKWNYLVLYEGGQQGYGGTVAHQYDGNDYLRGGAKQVVFPENKHPAYKRAYKVVEERPSLKRAQTW